MRPFREIQETLSESSDGDKRDTLAYLQNDIATHQIKLADTQESLRKEIIDKACQGYTAFKTSVGEKARVYGVSIHLTDPTFTNLIADVDLDIKVSPTVFFKQLKNDLKKLGIELKLGEQGEKASLFRANEKYLFACWGQLSQKTFQKALKSPIPKRRTEVIILRANRLVNDRKYANLLLKTNTMVERRAQLESKRGVVSYSFDDVSTLWLFDKSSKSYSKPKRRARKSFIGKISRSKSQYNAV